MRLLNVNYNHVPPSLRRGVQGAGVGTGSGGGGAGSVGAGSGGTSGGGRGRATPATPRREPLRVRSLLVRGKTCRSEMGVAQKNINFGKVAVGVL